MGEYPSATVCVRVISLLFAGMVVGHVAASESTEASAPVDSDVSGDGIYQTNLRSDGNRLVSGKAEVPSLSFVDVPLLDTPAWVAAVALEIGVLWAVALEDGRTQAFHVHSDGVTEVKIAPMRLPPGMPPLLRVVRGVPEFVLPAGAYSPLSSPLLLNPEGDLAYIDLGGNLIVERGDIEVVLQVNAQLDARILLDEKGRLLLNTDPTDEYPHGIMGDLVEAGSLTLVATEPIVRVIRTISMQDNWVIEGIAPILADFDGDDVREIIVTRSNAERGAQLIVLNETGAIVATGPAIGSGRRWRHQLVVAPFGPNGEMELADVLTPHIGGPTEFFQWRDAKLIRVAQDDGHTSHVIGSRNLDMVVAGRLDGTGAVTLLLPSQRRTELHAIQRGLDGAHTAWTLPLSGRLITNIGAVTTMDGLIAIGVGLDNGSLRIWQHN